MKYIIKRDPREVGAEVDNIFSACELGYYFASDFPELVKAGWKVHCKAHREDGEDGGETYHVDLGSGMFRARDIAEHINNPPRIVPIHDCPKCDCKPGCCR